MARIEPGSIRGRRMGLDEFRAKVADYRRAAGIAQKQLARELGMHPTVLSHKLNATDDMRLSQTEVKKIVKLLAGWRALYQRDEAIALLAMMNLPPAAFSDEEWGSPPLSTLAVAASSTMPDVEYVHERHNLPAPATRLIGREALITAICQRLIDPDVRLMTLTGPGGVGKTRLAIESARQMQHHFADGVLYVPLASIRDGALVTAEIARQVQLKEQRTSALTPEALKNMLAVRHLLLVLDNFEQVLDSAPMIGDWLEAAPRLSILVTSRAILNLYGEHQIRVPPLDLPNLQRIDTPDDLIRHPAVALFVERSQAARSDFALTDSTAQAIAEICVRLDGLPLALELAAARCRLFSPAALLQRLDQPLNLLSGGASNQAQRQRTLRDTITWSYTLLDAVEQGLFLTISAFPGGCTFEALEAVFIPPAVAGRDPLDCLTSLLDKSLIDRADTAEGAVYFTMLETLHEYGLDLLDEAGALAGLRERQVRYYAAWLETAAPGLMGEHQIAVANHFEAEHDNLRAVLTWALIYQKSAAVQLCGHLAYFWKLRGYINEGDRWLSQALRVSLPDDAPAQTQTDYARALHGAGSIAMLLGDHDRASAHLAAALHLAEQIPDGQIRVTVLLSLGDLAWENSDLPLAQHYYEESITASQQIGDLTQQATALNSLGGLLWQRDDLVQAVVHLSGALDLWRKLRHKRGIAHTLSNLGIVSVKQQQFERAMIYYAESLVLLRELGDERSAAVTLNNMGEVALQKGDFGTARRLYEDALIIQRRLNYARGIGMALTNRGSAMLFQGELGAALASLQEALVILRDLEDAEKLAIALEYMGVALLRMGDPERALIYHREALALSRDMDDLQGVASSLASIAAVFAVQGDTLRAAQIWGAAFRLWDASGAQMLPLDRQRFMPEMEAAQAVTDAQDFAAAWRAGEMLDMQTAAAAVL